MQRIAFIILLAGLSLSLIVVILLRVAGNVRYSKSLAEQSIGSFLTNDCALPLPSNSHFVNASGGKVHSPFFVRWWKEYFAQIECDQDSLKAWARELERRKQSSDFTLLTSGYAGPIAPHRNSYRIAEWWLPETNWSAMFVSVNTGGERTIAGLYGFMNTTNAQVYVHIVEK